MKCRVLFVFLLVIGLSSCSLDDDGANFRLEIVTIEEASLPDEFVFGETHEIKVTYNRPNNCYSFNNFLFDRDGNQRTVAVVNRVLTDTNCNNTATTSEATFNFLVLSRETYTFRFFQGKDDDGNDTFLTVEVPVAE